MLLRSRATIAATLSLIALAGCRIEVLQDVYLSDVAAVRESGTAMPADAVISIEVPSEEKCQEASSTLTPTLSAHFKAAEYKGCRKVEFTTFADFSVETEIVAEVVNQLSDSKFPVYLGVTETEAGAEIAVFRNNDSMRAMMDAIKEQTNAPVNDIGFAVAARIVNDTSESVPISLLNVFVGSEPVPFPKEHILDRRDEIVVRASDVANSGFGQGAWVVLAT
jgi:hypothetical protein